MAKLCSPTISPSEIEICPCLFGATCSARRYWRTACVIARAFAASGRPVKQCELCSEHGRFIAERGKRKGRPVRFLLD